MSFVIEDKDGFVFYDGPPPNGAVLRFKTEEEARSYLESGNWHLDGAFVRPARSEAGAKP